MASNRLHVLIPEIRIDVFNLATRDSCAERLDSAKLNELGTYEISSSWPLFLF